MVERVLAVVVDLNAALPFTDVVAVIRITPLPARIP